MDPLSVLGLVASAAQIIDLSAKLCKNLAKLCIRYHHAAQKLQKAASECATMQAAMIQIKAWIEHTLQSVADGRQLLEPLARSLLGCVAMLQEMSLKIEQYRPGRGQSLRAKFKAKYALDESFFRELLEDLRWQSSALHLLLSATALNVGQREETISHLAEATSLHVTESLPSGGLVFEFDHEVIASLPYRRAQASITQYKHNATQGMPLLDHPASGSQPTEIHGMVQRHSRDSVESTAPLEAEEGVFGSAMYAMDYFDRFFVKKRQLGRRGPRVTLLVTHVLDGIDLGSFACRRIPTGKNSEWVRRLAEEVSTLSSLSHENLASYRHIWLEDERSGLKVPSIYILQQFCNGGNLHDYVLGRTTISDRGGNSWCDRREQRRRVKRSQNLPFEEIFRFFKDIVSALNYLHQEGFMHGDLKAKNCLLQNTGNETRILLTNFGIVQRPYVTQELEDGTRSISYRAPETLTEGSYEYRSFKADIFSLGMTLFFMCFADLPYQYADVQDEGRDDFEYLREEILQWTGLPPMSPVRADLPKSLYRYLRAMVIPLPVYRPTAKIMLQSILTGEDLKFPLLGCEERPLLLDREYWRSYHCKGPLVTEMSRGVTGMSDDQEQGFVCGEDFEMLSVDA